MPETKTEKTKTAAEVKIYSKADSLKILNEEILNLLKEKRFGEISEFVHPEKGVRFSMYAFVNHESDKIFTKKDFEKYVNSRVKFTWGETDGEGKKLVMSVPDYLDGWVFNSDFTKSQFSLNQFQGKGNSLNNLQEVYRDADFTENYIPGTKKYGGMDWKTLRFVFEKYSGKYYLIAVINDEWTI